MILYQCLDFLVTVIEIFSLIVIMTCFLKKPRFNPIISKGIPFIILLVVTYMFTWFTSVGSLKSIFLVFVAILLLKLCYKDSLILDITTIEI